MKTPTRYLSVLLIAFALTLSSSALPAPVFAASAVGGEFQIWGGFLHLLGGFFRFGVANSGDSGPDTTPPTAPTNLTAVASSSSELDLSWTASTDNGGGDAIAGYKIFRAGSQVGTSTLTTYADTSLTASTTYTYVVKAFDAAGNVSSASNTATSTTGTWDDGVAAAPAGTAQYPNLLQGYAARAPWHVAGVDYYVGPQYTPTKDPATINMSGVSVDTTNKIVHITGNNVSLDGYDFTIGGTWSISIEGSAANTVIKNFVIQAAAGTAGQAGFEPAPITCASGAATNNTTIEYGIIDGEGLNSGVNSLISMFGGDSGLTVQYVWFNNSPEDFIDYSGGPLLVQYNLFDTYSFFVGAHSDAVQWNPGANSTNSLNQFNTIRQPPSAPGMLPFNSGFQPGVTTNEVVTNAVVANNTVSVPGTVAGAGSGCSFPIEFAKNSGATGAISGTAHDNYLDVTGCFGFAYPSGGSAGAPGIIYSNNISMVDGSQFTTNP